MHHAQRVFNQCQQGRRADGPALSRWCQAGVEDYRLEALPLGRTRFTYGVYLEPSFVVRLAGPIAITDVIATYVDNASAEPAVAAAMEARP